VNKRILWVDDDSEETLKSLEWLLNRHLRKKNNDSILSAKNCRDAIEIIEKGVRAESSRIHSLMLDVELPDDGSAGTLARFHGFSLAHKAADLGIKTIIFLTVVEQTLVAPLLREMENKHPEVYVEYYNKLDAQVDSIVTDLLAEKH